MPDTVRQRSTSPVVAGPSRPPAPARAPATRGRAPAGPDDAYIVAMFGEQARMFLTEADNAIHTPRLPSPYRRLLAPSPQGQARRGIAYHEADIDEPDDGPDTLQRLGAWARLVWRRMAGQARGAIRLGG